MKLVALMLLSFIGIIAFVEFSNILNCDNYHPIIKAAGVAHEYVLSWPRLPYWGYYEVEVLKSLPSSDVSPAPAAERIVTYRTLNTEMTINANYPSNTYWRVSAHGLFRHPLGTFSAPINLAAVEGSATDNSKNIKPVATSFYPADSPASDKPDLLWTTVPGAVSYEVEILSSPPEDPNDINPSQYRIASTREVYTNGFNADLSNSLFNHVYWRVRALDYDGKPLGVYSDTEKIFIDHNKKLPLKPRINTVFNENGMATPLFPVYSWIPIVGASSYEIEVLSHPPEDPNSVTPSNYRIWKKESVGFDCYDDQPRLIPGVYYWRVRGLDQNGNPVGVFSDTSQFVVDLAQGNYAATFGDSITHGGGGISYSPANWEYSFQTYLNFPVVNLGKSGDTSEAMLQRFDRDVLPFHPKYLIILGGTNSLRGGTPAKAVIDDLAKIRDKCLAYGIRPIFLTLPPINPNGIMRAFEEDTVSNWREEFDTVNSFIRRQRYYIDLDLQMSDAQRELPGYCALDGLHPDIEGKKIMAQIINANWARVTR